MKTDNPFPPVSSALKDPNGLLAVTDELTTSRILEGYRLGIFPWYADNEPILWWSPDPRTVFLIEQFTPSRSLRRLIRKKRFQISLNHAFEAVIEACAQPRISGPGTWITTEMQAAYLELHRQGYAHSIELWDDKVLVGGIYGIAIGTLFCGESMFSGVDNGSKIALTALVYYLKQFQFKVLDCQVENNHIRSLGSINLRRETYLDYVKQSVNQVVDPVIWQPQFLDLVRLMEQRENVSSD